MAVPVLYNIPTDPDPGPWADLQAWPQTCLMLGTCLAFDGQLVEPVTMPCCLATPGDAPLLLAPKEPPAHTEGSVKGNKTTTKGNKELTDSCILQESTS